MSTGDKQSRLRLWDHGFVIFSICGILVMATLAVIWSQFERRLNTIEDRLISEPARRYIAPNLDEYAADEVSPDAVLVEKTVYVPVYSHVYFDGGRPHLLEATLSIRNTDPTHPVYVRSVKYYNTNGEMVRAHVDRTIQLGPLVTVEFLVERQETEGGSGANFVVEWMATEPASEPMIEAVMVGMFGARAFSFAREGRVVSLAPEP